MATNASVEELSALPDTRVEPGTRKRPPFPNMVWIPGGTFRMGSDRHYREEGPVREVTVQGFWMDVDPVTNAQFARFVRATGYRTVAERPLNAADYPGAIPEMLVPGSVVFHQPTQPLVDLRNHYAWWRYVPGANWKHPTGPKSGIQGLGAHPVVHVAYEDVVAYARWAHKEIPTEAEWEFAARGGLDGAEYAWGDELSPGGRIMANVWQGPFPVRNLLEDGYERTSPVGTFPPNGYGLHDMIGNVWEWTSDWWGQSRGAAGSCCGADAVENDIPEESYDSGDPKIRIPRKVLKGGSYLCAANYCVRYRPAARIAQHIDTGTGHQGFRCIVRVMPPGSREMPADHCCGSSRDQGMNRLQRDQV